MATRKKNPVHKVIMTEGKRQIIQQLLQEYDIETAEDIQDALKDLLGGTIKEMMEAEMDTHLGYEKSERSDSDDYRNGYKEKTVNSSYGSVRLEVPQDRKSTFNPKVVKKRQKDISDIDQKIISMYAKGMTTRQISDTLMDIYGFEVSEGFISDVTDKILPQIEEWQNRPLDDIYPVLFIDAIHYSVRDNGIIRKLAAYVILGISCEGKKDVLTIEVGENESSKYWLSVLNGLKNRGVKDILIICIPASLIAILVASFVQNFIGKELEEDPEYIRRVKEGIINPKEDARLMEQMEQHPDKHAKYSVIAFLLGVFLVVLFGSVPSLRPSFMVDGEPVRIGMPETIEIIMMSIAILCVKILTKDLETCVKSHSFQIKS